MIKVLAIGNSFSDDALTFVRDIGLSVGEDIVTGNLYIGGCSLERHWKNAIGDIADYSYRRTGRSERPAAIREVLTGEDWDVVTLQQASHFSGLYDTYQPYLNALSGYVRLYAHDARQMIHETWAYETDSTHPGFAAYDRDQEKMHEMLSSCYQRARQDIAAQGFIPCGEAFRIARRMPPFDYAHGGKSLNRDGFHASYTCGRYLLGCVWVETLTGRSLENSDFVPVIPGHEELTPTAEELFCLRRAAHEAVMSVK